MSFVNAEAPNSWEDLDRVMKTQGYEGMEGEEGKASYREATRGVPCHCPAPSSIQRCPFFGNNPHDASSSEGFWVHLALNFEYVQWQKELLNILSINDSGSGIRRYVWKLTTSPIPVRLQAMSPRANWRW